MNLMNLIKAFPDFPISEIPAFTQGMMVDTSYGNEATPSFSLEDKSYITMYVNREQSADRDGAPRFNVAYGGFDELSPMWVYAGDDFQKALWAVMKLDEMSEESARDPEEFRDYFAACYRLRLANLTGV